MHLTLARVSLRQLLPVLFFLLAAVPAGSIGVVLTNKSWDRELQTVREQHLQLAHNLVEALERYAEDVEAVFEMIVTAKASVVDDLPTRKLDDLLRRLHFKYICIVNVAGQTQRLIFPQADRPIEHVSAQLLETLRVADADADHPPEFSDILPDHLGDPTIFLWQRLDAQRYALGALKTDYFIRLQSAISFGENGYAVIVDRSGKIIAHPNPEWRQRIHNMSQTEPVRRMMAGETDVARFMSEYVDAEAIAGFTTTPKTGWGVMIPQPLSELQAHVSQVRRTVWFVIGLALLFATLLGGLVSRCLATPLQRIGQAASRFATGSYDARVGELGAFHTRETVSLATRFNRMADDVNASWQAQSESEQRCREFAEIAADWFWETDCQQIFTYVSQPTGTTPHGEAGVLLGHHRSEYVYNDPEGTIAARIQNHMDREESFDNVVHQVLDRKGRPIYLSVAGRPMRDASGHMVGYRGVARDISELLHTQAQLRQAQRSERLRHTQKLEAIGTLAGGIAHDFNNILGAILGYTDLVLHQSTLDDTTRLYLQQVFASGNRAKELVKQILTFGRKSEPLRQPVHLDEIVEEALSLLRATLPATITIQHDIDKSVDTIDADATQIHQVLMNLGTNAEYAMRNLNGFFEVRLDAVEVDEAIIARHAALRPGPHARLTVRDTGHGMTPDVLARIFEPFFTTKDVGEGTGMGLAVVHGIVTNHGGSISVRSSPREGTIFEIYLPQHSSATSCSVSLEAPILNGNGSILFVDDEEAIALLGQGMLEHLGYEVAVFTSSLAALETFRQAPHRFDLVITDQTMPSLTGEALADELRRIRPDIPIVLCTGFSHAIDAKKAKAQGIDAFLMKPIMGHDLFQVVQRILSQKTGKI